MDKSAPLYRRIYRLYEQPWLFNLNQTLLDGGKARQIHRFLADVPYRSVVDVGCGTGNWVRLARGPYLGIDTSPSFIEACRRRHAGRSDTRFLEADATTVDLDERFDLAMLISVLHHLSDDEAVRLLGWMARQARYVFVLDLYPIPANPLARWLYAHDRGDYIRSPEAQRALLLHDDRLTSVKEDDYYAPTRLYRHTLFLLESQT